MTIVFILAVLILTFTFRSQMTLMCFFFIFLNKNHLINKVNYKAKSRGTYKKQRKNT